MRSQFLRQMSLPGIKLALSDTGGALGERRLPLLQDRESWDLLAKRCLELASEGTTTDGADIVTTLTTALETEVDRQVKEILSGILQQTLSAITDSWNTRKLAFGEVELLTIVRASTLVHVLPPIPNLDLSWSSHLEVLGGESLKNASTDTTRASELEKWVAFAGAIKTCEPRFLVRIRFPAAYEAQLREFLSRCQQETERRDFDQSSYELENESRRMRQLKRCVDAIGEHCSALTTDCYSLSGELDAYADELREVAREMEDEGFEDDRIIEGNSRTDRAIDIDLLFSDL